MVTTLDKGCFLINGNTIVPDDAEASALLSSKGVNTSKEEARQNTILDKGPEVSFVSGMSPSLFESIITGKNGYDLMIEKLVNSGRYNDIHA